MIVRFNEKFQLPIDEVYGYFRTPADWTRIFGFPGSARELDDGWYSVPLKIFPFPLVAKNTEEAPPTTVRWVFRGFWKGDGEIRLTQTDTGVLVEGFERIAIRRLGLLSPMVERLFLEKGFRRIWEIGWNRLRKRTDSDTRRPKADS